MADQPSAIADTLLPTHHRSELAAPAHSTQTAAPKLVDLPQPIPTRKTFMRSDNRIRFGKTRGTPEHYFRVQVSLDREQSFTDALVMKRDDRDGPNKSDRPYRVEWAATTELRREAETALSTVEKRYSAKHTKSELRKFFKGVPGHYVPPDAEIPVDLGERIARARVGLGMHAGTEPNAWEQEADAAALRRARLAEQAEDEGKVRTAELFHWVPWFEELAVKVGEMRREGLVEGAKKVDWAGLNCAVLSQGDEKADPLTFFYHLASIARGTTENRATVYASVAEVFGIESDLDYGLGHSFIFPQGNPVNVKFEHAGDDPNLLWDMFDQARGCGPGGEPHDTAIGDTFAKSLRINRVGVAKLTHTLFLVNPTAFLPFDKDAVLPLGIGRLNTAPASISWDEYVAEMGRIRAAFPGCQCYEINVIGYLWTRNPSFPRRGNRWYQIDACDDKWRDFCDNNWVYLSGQEDQQRGGIDEPKRGDVVLVRTGTREGRGIGIVYRNDYNERSHGNGRIHVLWINKKQGPLAADMPSLGFSEAGRAEYVSFAESDAYSATLNLLQPPPENINTLYAKFYQPLVARLREEGMQPGAWRGSWRSFHTGHQGAVYGTGLDGGKAKVFLQFSGAGNEQRFRALLQHREKIDGKMKGTVAWLDESQGTWETAVLLVGDAALNLTGPEEDLEAMRVWIADTLLALRDAVQPHLAEVMQGKRTSPKLPSPAALMRSLTDRGLLFLPELVANYVLALQTKRFAILTGISGTGKTKIATVVAELFRSPRHTTVTTIPDEAIGIDVMPYMLRYSSMVIPVVLATNLSLLDSDAPRADRQIRVRYPDGQATLTYRRSQQGATFLIFRGEFKVWFRSHVTERDRIWLRIWEGETPESDELEIGLSETETVEAPVDNHVVIPVRPDWVDNRGLLGYLNPLTTEYSTTPFLKLLLRARAEEKRAKDEGEKPHPFFVILDEMNLARVEHYFSDFLSALESGKAIHLHEDEAIESGKSESGPQVPRKLKIPGNVLFTGTVNVDETTYMFSPKVLDRAFTIEFDRVDLKGFAEDNSSDDTSVLNLDGVEGSLDLLPAGRSKDNDWKPSREDWVEFSEQTAGHHAALMRLHDILEARHRHFGYRVANEIARFMNLAREQAKDTGAAVDAAFDLALLQKVLPKFHGTQQELQSLLEQIFHFAVQGGGYVPKKEETVQLDDWKVVRGRLVGRPKTEVPSPAPSQTPSDDAESNANEADSDTQDAADAGSEAPAYPRTGAKVLRMLKRLRDRGFTSFIE